MPKSLCHLTCWTALWVYQDSSLPTENYRDPSNSDTFDPTQPSPNDEKRRPFVYLGHHQTKYLNKRTEGTEQSSQAGKISQSTSTVLNLQEGGGAVNPELGIATQTQTNKTRSDRLRKATVMILIISL